MLESLEPIIIRYDGIDAEHHEIDLALLGESLKGGARLLAVAGHLATTGIYVSRTPAMQVKVLAGTPRDGCYQIPAQLVGIVTALPLITPQGRALLGLTVKAVVNYMLAKLGGDNAVAMKALDVANTAILANKEVTVKALDFAKEAGKAADDQRPAARSFAVPVGKTAATALIGDKDDAFIIDVNARKQIDHEVAVEIGPSQPFMVTISELDVHTGSCKIAIDGDDSGERYSGEITDPVVRNPRSPYSAALDNQSNLRVVAKPHLIDGALKKLTISDTTS